MDKEKPIVKYDGKWWVMESVQNGMATLWRDGQPAVVPERLIEAKQGEK